MDCTYSQGVKKGASTVGDRIRELESLVSSLIRQQESHSPPATINRAIAEDLTWKEAPDGLDWVDNCSNMNQINIHTNISSVHDEGFLPTDIQPPQTKPEARPSGSSPSGIHGQVSELASIRGSLRRAKYVDSSHWESVLDGISQLKDQYELEEEQRISATDNGPTEQTPGPRLLYQPVYTTRAEILASLPERPLVDRLVARYFNEKNALLREFILSG